MSDRRRRGIARAWLASAHGERGRRRRAGRRRRRTAPPASATSRPDVALVDVRMPPTYTDEGLRTVGEMPLEVPRDRRARALADASSPGRAPHRRATGASRLSDEGARRTRRTVARRVGSGSSGRLRRRSGRRRRAPWPRDADRSTRWTAWGRRAERVNLAPDHRRPLEPGHLQTLCADPRAVRDAHQRSLRQARARRGARGQSASPRSSHLPRSLSSDLGSRSDLRARRARRGRRTGAGTSRRGRVTGAGSQITGCCIRGSLGNAPAEC